LPASFQRKVLKPIHLSNGTVLPAGVTIEIPAYGTSRDPTTFPNPEEFDGLRFYRMREANESFNSSSASTVEAAAHNQFVSVSQNSLPFGYGRHACPGRFFAANEIKMIIARSLLTWDVRNVNGAKERYPNLDLGVNCVPDPRRELEFKEI
jgi:cytochrome P450